jgi:hypothetical protein
MRQLAAGPVATDFALFSLEGRREAADAITDEPRQTTPRPILNSIEAQLLVANIESSCDFYTNKLGFAVRIRLWRSAILRASHPRQCTEPVNSEIELWAFVWEEHHQVKSMIVIPTRLSGARMCHVLSVKICIQ